MSTTTDRPLRILIAQPWPDGHYLHLYVRFIAREARRRGWAADLLTTERAVKHRAFLELVSEGLDPAPHLMPDPHYPAQASAPGFLYAQMGQWRALRRGFRDYARRHTPDLVLIGNLDNSEKAIALLGSPFGSTPFAGIAIATRHHHRSVGLDAPGTRSDALYARLFERLLRIPTFGAYQTVDPLLERYSRERGIAFAEKIDYVPDAASLGPADRAVSRAALGLRDDQIAVLAYGALAERKGVDALVAAAADPACPPNVVVVIAGRATPYLEQLLSGQAAQRLNGQGRLIVRAEFLDDAAEAQVFYGSDIVWLGYRAFYGSSGVLLQAARSGRPIIATRNGLVGWTTTRHGLGPTIDVDDPAAVLAALRQLALDPAARQAAGQAGLALGDTHLPESYGRAVGDSVLAALRRTGRTGPP